MNAGVGRLPAGRDAPVIVNRAVQRLRCIRCEMREDPGEVKDLGLNRLVRRPSAMFGEGVGQLLIVLLDRVRQGPDLVRMDVQLAAERKEVPAGGRHRVALEQFEIEEVLGPSGVAEGGQGLVAVEVRIVRIRRDGLPAGPKERRHVARQDLHGGRVDDGVPLGPPRGGRRGQADQQAKRENQPKAMSHQVSPASTMCVESSLWRNDITLSTGAAGGPWNR